MYVLALAMVFGTVQAVAFGLYVMPLNFMWEKVCGVHQSHYLKRVACRVPIGLLLWLLALMFPFFGPLNSMIGSMFMSFSVFIIPCVAYTITFWSPSARQVIVQFQYYPFTTRCATECSKFIEEEDVLNSCICNAEVRECYGIGCCPLKSVVKELELQIKFSSQRHCSLRVIGSPWSYNTLFKGPLQKCTK